MDKNFVFLKMVGKKENCLVSLDHIVRVDLMIPLRLFLSNGEQFEVSQEDAPDFKMLLQRRSVYSDETPCERL